MKKRVATTTAVFPPGYPAKKAIERLASLGFEALDMALDYWTQQPDSPFLGDGYLEWAKELRKTAKDYGICYVQSHSPGNTVMNEKMFARSLEISSALGAPYMVVHPQYTYPDGTVIEDEEDFIRYNSELIRPWLQKAQQCGVVILSENLLWGASKDPRIIAALVREVGSDWFGWCYDTGHAHCFGYTSEVLRECAIPPLSLHMQDNHGDARDEHLIPGDGTVSWEELVVALNEEGYKGDCVLEAHHQSLEVSDEERDAILVRLLESARYLREKMV